MPGIVASTRPIKIYIVVTTFECFTSFPIWSWPTTYSVGGHPHRQRAIFGRSRSGWLLYKFVIGLTFRPAYTTEISQHKVERGWLISRKIWQDGLKCLHSFAYKLTELTKIKVSRYVKRGLEIRVRRTQNAEWTKSVQSLCMWYLRHAKPIETVGDEVPRGWTILLRLGLDYLALTQLTLEHRRESSSDLLSENVS